MNRDLDGALYLVIHSGSRRLGRDVANYWQNEAFCLTNGFDPKLFARRKIDTKRGVLRKGAVSAQAGEKLIIPINMRDGSLLCVGKGNPEWNFTAPHGAGRMLTRSQAKAELSLEDYRAAMAGIYTTSVSETTLDESPMAYRAIDEILDVIEETAEVTAILTPIYNFKASKAAVDEETRDGND